MTSFEAIHFHRVKLKAQKITSESMSLLGDVLKLLDLIEPIDEVDHVHSFWLRIDKGSFEEWKKDVWTKKEFDECSDRKLKRVFNKRFNEEHYWFNIYASYNDRYNFKYLKFGDFHIDINATNEYPRPAVIYEYDLTNFLTWFKEQVINIIEELKNGKYNNFIADNLPYAYRFGIVQRDIYWKYFPADKDFFIKDLTKEEIARFISLAEIQDNNYIPKKRIKDMTFMKYFSWAATAYKAAKYDLPTDDVVKLFFKYGEDFGSNVLYNLDYNSVKDFEDYYNDRLGAAGGHPWGIRLGSSRTRIMLLPRHDDGGYYFVFYGEPTYMIYDMVKMYLALYDLGVSLSLGMPKEMIEYLREEDLIGIEPHHYLHIYSYRCYGNKTVRDSRIYDEENNPEFFKCIEWMPIKELRLKESN